MEYQFSLMFNETEYRETHLRDGHPRWDKVRRHPLFAVLMRRPDTVEVQMIVWGGPNDVEIGKGRAIQCLLYEARLGLMEFRDFVNIMDSDLYGDALVTAHTECKNQLERVRILYGLTDIDDISAFAAYVDGIDYSHLLRRYERGTKTY